MKIVMIITLAKYFKDKESDPPYGLVQLIVPILILALPMYLINKQPDLGTTLALAATGFSIILFVGIHRKNPGWSGYRRSALHSTGVVFRAIGISTRPRDYLHPTPKSTLSKVAIKSFKARLPSARACSLAKDFSTAPKPN